MAAKWRETYNFKEEGKGIAFRTDKFIGGKSQNPMNPKDRFAIADCEDVWTKRVLEFLISIFYPKKPTYVTMTVGNTIFEALLGYWLVDWGLVLYAMVARLAENIRKGKLMPICPTSSTSTRNNRCYFWKRSLPTTSATTTSNMIVPRI